MNIYFHELRSYRKNTIIWIAAICAGALLFFSMFPAFANNAGELAKVLKNYPPVVQKAFGLSMDQISNIPGFYSFIITFLTLCGAVQAMNLGISVVAKETTGKTADFLLTKPVTRKSVITSKLLAVFTCIAVTSGVYIGVSTALAMAVKVKDFDFTPFILMSLSFFFLQVIFLALGFVIAVVVPKIRSVLPVSLSVVFGFFIIGAVTATLNLEDLYYLSPFKYFNTTDILKASAYKPSFVIVGALVVAVSVLISYVLYSKKDIHAA
jgi:ABC-2 type transport system permease protein